MFRTYFIIAARHLEKQKMYSVIKIGGFALSIAACLLIALYIKTELSYDKNWENADRIFRLVGEYNNEGKLETGVDWPAPMSKALQDEFPQIEKAGRLMDAPLFAGAGHNQIRSVDQEQNTYEEGFTYADKEILDILSIPMVYGNRKTALSEPNTMVISRSKAEKYFPGQDPVGKLMVLNNDTKKLYKIGGVMEDFPSTSHIDYDFLLTMTGHQLWDGEQNNWLASNYPVYVLLKDGTNASQFESKLRVILDKYYIPALKSNGILKPEELFKSARFILQPIKQVHLYSSHIDDRMKKGDIRFIWLFGAVAFFILLIACINFINLSTAKSANRAKEVGLRKVVGSMRISLIQQFLVESTIYSLLSFVLGLLFAAVALPAFNNLSGKSLAIPWTEWWLFPSMLLASLIVGVAAGLYPSFYLSSFKPIQVLKGQVSRGTRSSILRNGLVVFQFTTSIILIIGTLVIYHQTNYILTKKVGFDKDQVLLIQGTNTLQDQREAFRTELLKSSEIKSVSIGDYLPIDRTKRDFNTFHNEGKAKEEIGVAAQKWYVDYDYLNTLNLKMAEGRFLSRNMAFDSAGVVINQAMAAKFGYKDPIGKRIENGWEKFTVIGVVEDFNFENMKQNVGPLCLVLGNYNSSIIAVKMNGTDSRSAIDYASTVWKKFSPNQPFRYTFLDEGFADMYADVQRKGSIFGSFAILAIIIACLGLFALSAFMAEQRTKEIGIRKVLGASVSGITTMLSRDFLKLVFIAIMIASPIAYWAMTKWLQDFAYRISISWWMIALAGGIALIIALVTISFQSIKAALLNPVKSLRSE